MDHLRDNQELDWDRLSQWYFRSSDQALILMPDNYTWLEVFCEGDDLVKKGNGLIKDVKYEYRETREQ